MATVFRYLADTSVFTHRHYPSVDAVLVLLLDRGLIAVCGMVEMEVLLSARPGDDV